MRNISLNPFSSGSFWNNNKFRDKFRDKFRERRIQIALTPADSESTSRTLSHDTDATDVTSVIPVEHSRILLHKELTPTLVGSASRTLSPSTHTTDVTNGGLLSRHSQGSLHEDQNTEIRHADMWDTSANQSLPVEILGEIFQHCVEAEAGGWYASPDTRSAPLLLCQVCAYWRQVAISTPVLWSKFSAQSIRSLRSELIQLWLDRSQAYPLSFHIGQWGPSHSGPLLHAYNIMSLFFPHFSRCYDLSIYLDNTLVRQLLSIPITAKNSVESFTLNTNICTKEFIYQIPDLIHSFTNIRRLSISARGADRMSQSPLLTIPWSQLTHVELTSFPLPVKTFALILAQCVELVELSVDSLRGKQCNLALPDASTPILLRHLRFLHIRCYCLTSYSDGSGAQCCAEELLQVLTLPALRQFSFCHDTGCATWGRVYFPEFIVQSGCPLESLTISFYDLVEDDIIALLSLPHLQSLRKIDLTCHHISDRTLDLLTYPSSGTGVLPNLESIGVLLFSRNTSDGRLADMVASRWSPNPTTRKISHLATLEYHFYDYPCPCVPKPCHDQDDSRIRKFKEDGLKVSF